MLNLIERLLSWLMPARGKRRAEDVPTPEPTRATKLEWPAVTLFAEHPLRGEDVALIRPFLLAHEAAQEKARQRERRTALILAASGVDYAAMTA